MYLNVGRGEGSRVLRHSHANLKSHVKLLLLNDDDDDTDDDDDLPVLC